MYLHADHKGGDVEHACTLELVLDATHGNLPACKNLESLYHHMPRLTKAVGEQLNEEIKLVLNPGHLFDSSRNTICCRLRAAAFNSDGGPRLGRRIARTTASLQGCLSGVADQRACGPGADHGVDGQR